MIPFSKKAYVFFSFIFLIGYELPAVCRDLHNEVRDIVREHHLVTNKHKHWTGFHWDALIPRYLIVHLFIIHLACSMLHSSCFRALYDLRALKSIVGDMVCIHERTPQCKANFMMNMHQELFEIEEELEDDWNGGRGAAGGDL